MSSRNARVILSATDRASKVIKTVSLALLALGGVAAGVGLVMLRKKLVAGVRSGIEAFKDFDKQLSGTAAVMEKTRGEIGQLEQQAKDLGRTTIFTSRDVAKAQFTLAKAGFKVNSVFKMMPGIVNMAAAAEIGLGDAAKITAGLIKAFQLDASASTDVADLLAKAANTARVTITEMGEAMKFASAPANALGVTMTELSAGIQVAQNNMVETTIAGTSLHTLPRRRPTPPRRRPTPRLPPSV